MPISSPLHVPLINQLLFALSHEEYARLAPYLERVQLAHDKVLYEADDKIKYGYFFLSGMASLLANTEEGRMIEVSEVGTEGVIGLPVVMGIHNAPYRVVVQVKASAMRIRADVLLREFNRGTQLQGVLLSYIHTRLTRISQAVICNHFHTVEQRFSRWLLTTQDRVHTNRLHLTQQNISDILGTPRTNVSMCASILQQNKIIHCTRGLITIIDQEGLEASACNCYREMKQGIGTVLAA